MINEQNQQVLTSTLYMAVALMAAAGIYQLVKAYTALHPVPTPLAQQTFTVTGEGEAVGVPDVAKISIGITQQGDAVADVTTATNEAMTNIISIVKSAGIDAKDIRTTAYSISPRYDYSRNRQGTIIGYQIDQSASVTIRDLSRVAAIIDEVTTAGANTVSGPSFEIDNPDSVQTEARNEAFTKAQAKAESLAQAAGVTLGDIVTFSEDGNTAPRYETFYNSALEGITADTKEATIEPGSQEVRVSMSVTYRLQ